MKKWPKTIASRLKNQLLLESESLTEDGIGGYISNWTTLATLWAEIMPISGREKLFSNQLTSNVRYRIILRYRGQVTPAMRLREESGGRIYNIRSVIDVEEKKQLVEILADVTKP